VVPNLGLYGFPGYRGAVGLGQWCLRSNPKVEAITVYSTGDAAAQEGFRMEKLEGR
jgi:hypothetical protein